MMCMSTFLYIFIDILLLTLQEKASSLEQKGGKEREKAGGMWVRIDD